MRRAIVRLGVAQCTLWGVLYYAFAVILEPMAKTLGVSTDVAVGAFSVALAVSAIIAPRAGRAFDAGRAARILRMSALFAAVLVVAWALTPSIWTLYFTFTGLGVCMALTLYEAAYGVVTVFPIDAARRSQAWAQLTIFGGLASVVFVPLTHFLVESVGWRNTLLLLAIPVAASGFLVPQTAAHKGVLALAPTPVVAPHSAPNSETLSWIVTFTTFAAGAGTVLSVILYANLIERGVSPAAAALVSATLGLMQLPGRFWLAIGNPPRVHILLWTCVMLQAAGLFSLAAGSALPVLPFGASAFGLGAGLLTLASPMALAAAVGDLRVNQVAGVSARAQSFARAAAPYSAAAAISLTGSFGLILGSLALAITLAGFLAKKALEGARV